MGSATTNEHVNSYEQAREKLNAAIAEGQDGIFVTVPSDAVSKIVLAHAKRDDVEVHTGVSDGRTLLLYDMLPQQCMAIARLRMMQYLTPRHPVVVELPSKVIKCYMQKRTCELKSSRTVHISFQKKNGRYWLVIWKEEKL